MVTFCGSLIGPCESAGYIKYEGHYIRGNGDTFSFWFGCDERYRERISDTSEGWYLLGLTAAFALNESYRHPEPVCTTLVRNSRAVVCQWSDWFSRKETTTIEVTERRNVPIADSTRGVGCLFTAGVDSSFTLSQRYEEISTLITATFDFGDGGSQFLPINAARIQAHNADYGRENFVIGTNALHAFPEYSASWSYLTHGPTLAAMVHLFGRGFRKAYISSSFWFGQLITPWGSHPLTDPLFSSSSLQFEHFGATYSRFEKLEALVSDRLAPQKLLVCGQIPTQKRGRLNCSTCQKCLATMAALDACGVKPEDATAFVWDEYSPDSIAAIRLHHPNQFIFFHKLILHAAAHSRLDIAEAARAAIRRSRPYLPIVAAENWARRRFVAVSRIPAFRRLKRQFYGLVR